MVILFTYSYLQNKSKRKFEVMRRLTSSGKICAASGATAVTTTHRKLNSIRPTHEPWLVSDPGTAFATLFVLAGIVIPETGTNRNLY